jgi:16S rRNA (guanine527-N7)-methyltransferase
MSDFSARLQSLAMTAGVDISPADLARLNAYFELLKRWNAKMNLTALPLDGPPDRTLLRLFVEPLAAARFVPDSSLRWIDVGSSGGSPAIPLKILRPRWALTMVESKTRKAAFLREVVRALNLSNADVQAARFEDVRAGEPVDLLTVRAVRLDGAFLAHCRTVIRPGGMLLLFQSTRGADAPAGFIRLGTERLLQDAESFADVLQAQ